MQIIAKEGTRSLFKGAGANILRGIAGAGVLALYDKLQRVMFGKVYSGGLLSLFFYTRRFMCSQVLKDLANRILKNWLAAVNRDLERNTLCFIGLLTLTLAQIR